MRKISFILAVLFLISIFTSVAQANDDITLSNITRKTGGLETHSIFARYRVRVHNNTNRFIGSVTINILVYKGETQTGSCKFMAWELPPKAWKESEFEFYKSDHVVFDGYKYYYRIKY